MKLLKRKKCLRHKRGYAGIVRSFSKGTDRIATFLLDSKKKRSSVKSKKLSNELAFVVKDIASSVSVSLRDLKVKDTMRRIAYEVGIFSKDVKDTCITILTDVTQ